jgi:hypothetical protein
VPISIARSTQEENNLRLALPFTIAFLFSFSLLFPDRVATSSLYLPLIIFFCLNILLYLRKTEMAHSYYYSASLALA